MSISTSPAACASPSRPPIWRWRRRWSRRSACARCRPDTVVFGEIGLSGEVRPVSQAEARLKEAGKLGFTPALLPPARGRGKEREPASGVARREIRHLRDLVDAARRRASTRAAQSRDAGSDAMNGLDLAVVDGDPDVRPLRLRARLRQRSAVDRRLGRRRLRRALRVCLSRCRSRSKFFPNGPVTEVVAGIVLFLVA